MAKPATVSHMPDNRDDELHRLIVIADFSGALPGNPLVHQPLFGPMGYAKNPAQNIFVFEAGTYPVTDRFGHCPWFRDLHGSHD